MNIDKLNLLLLVISFLLAYYLPFELFLFAYAFLGPLHYLTEINWIRDKNYFVKNNVWIYLVILFAIIYSLPYIFSLSIFSKLINDSLINFLRVELVSFNNVLLFLILTYALLSILFKTYKALILGFILSILLSFLFYKNSSFILVIGLLVPTIIHVYLFTVLFMFYGWRKNKNIFGTINLITILSIPLILFLIDFDVSNYNFNTHIKNTYVNNNFHILNANISKLLGVYSDLRFFFYEKVDLKIQIFIAFAYIYHYLNWFSKTTIIGWHKQITNKKAILIFVIWFGIALFYMNDYRLGLIVSIFFSILHVMLEFPLNFITIKSLFTVKNI